MDSDVQIYAAVWKLVHASKHVLPERYDADPIRRQIAEVTRPCTAPCTAAESSALRAMLCHVYRYAAAGRSMKAIEKVLRTFKACVAIDEYSLRAAVVGVHGCRPEIEAVTWDALVALEKRLAKGRRTDSKLLLRVDDWEEAVAMVRAPTVKKPSALGAMVGLTDPPCPDCNQAEDHREGCPSGEDPRRYGRGPAMTDHTCHAPGCRVAVH